MGCDDLESLRSAQRSVLASALLWSLKIPVVTFLPCHVTSPGEPDVHLDQAHLRWSFTSDFLRKLLDN